MSHTLSAAGDNVDFALAVETPGGTYGATLRVDLASESPVQAESRSPDVAVRLVKSVGPPDGCGSVRLEARRADGQGGVHVIADVRDDDVRLALGFPPE